MQQCEVFECQAASPHPRQSSCSDRSCPPLLGCPLTVSSIPKCMGFYPTSKIFRTGATRFKQTPMHTHGRHLVEETQPAIVDRLATSSGPWITRSQTLTDAHRRFAPGVTVSCSGWLGCTADPTPAPPLKATPPGSGAVQTGTGPGCRWRSAGRNWRRSGHRPRPLRRQRRRQVRTPQPRPAVRHVTMPSRFIDTVF